MSTKLPLFALTCLSLSSLACILIVDDVIDTGADSTDEADVGEDIGTGETGTSTGTDTGTTDADTGTTDADTGTTDTSTGTTGGDMCLAKGDASFSYQYDFGPVDEWDTNLQVDCTVDSVGIGDDGTVILALACADLPQPVSISVKSNPAIALPLAGGELVTVHYVSEGPWWFNSYLRLDVEGLGHMLTIIDGDSLMPPENYGFALPVDITVKYELCAWFDGGCGQVERLGLGTVINSEDATVLDGDYAIVGGDPGTEFWVQSAEHLHEIQCTDTPDEWFKVMIANTGWE